MRLSNKRQYNLYLVQYALCNEMKFYMYMGAANTGEL